jgi:hypothetical protein
MSSENTINIQPIIDIIGKIVVDAISYANEWIIERMDFTNIDSPFVRVTLFLVIVGAILSTLSAGIFYRHSIWDSFIDRISR